MAEQLEIFVTGASSGIGRATAIELASRGHRIFAGARREDALAQLAEANEGIVSAPLDVTDATSVAAAADAVEELTSARGVDVLINAAGYALVGPVEALASA